MMSCCTRRATFWEQHRALVGHVSHARIVKACIRCSLHRSSIKLETVVAILVAKQKYVRRAIFWVQHGALAEERRPDGSLQYRRSERAPDSFAGADGDVIADPDDDEFIPVHATLEEVENSCAQFLPVRFLNAGDYVACAASSRAASAHAIVREMQSSCAHCLPARCDTTLSCLACVCAHPWLEYGATA